MSGAIVPPKWAELLTRNLSPRRKRIQGIVLHHSGGSERGDLPTLLGETKAKVSADFYVNKPGTLYKLNPQLSLYYTWHAGVSLWRGLWDVNKITIGVEIEHRPGEPWTDEQIATTAHLCAWVVDRYKLKLDDGPITSHRAVAWVRGRKTDPEGFPWAKFGAQVREHLGV